MSQTDACIAWFSVPAHYTPVLLALYSLIEYILGKSSKIKPNSVLDLVLHLISGRIGQILAAQGVPVPPAPPAEAPPSADASAGPPPSAN